MKGGVPVDYAHVGLPIGGIAQLVEQRTHKPLVGGSNPSPATSPPIHGLNLSPIQGSPHSRGAAC